MAVIVSAGPSCPVPLVATDRIQLGHGSGGKMSAALLRDRFLPHLGNAVLNQLGDAAVLPVHGGDIAMSTDTFVVSPVEFPGGNIGSLAVHGTLNDLAMMGARPLCLTAGFVLEEGLDMALLDRVLASMAAAASAAGAPVVSGDTKVVERGKADQLYINTTGIGVLRPEFRPAPDKARPGDAVLVSGPIGSHGMAIMAAREGIAFEAAIESDAATLFPLVELLRKAVGDSVHVLRDPTRGGLASALNEIAAASQVGVVLDDGALQVPGPVASVCDLLGLDVMYVANEGVLVAFVEASAAQPALAALRRHPLGRSAVIAGTAVAAHPGLVVLRTGLGGTRIVDMLPGDQLPRIC